MSLNNSKQPAYQSYLLIILLILIWGINWPVIKFALIDIPPLWLAYWRFFIGLSCLTAYLVFTKNIRLPTLRDLPIIFSVSFLQMAGFVILTNFGLMHVPASRSAILAYTTPLWVMPLTLFWLKEPVSRLKLIGFLLGMLGIFVLFNPISFNWYNKEAVLGNSLLILAAIMWAVCMVQARFTRWVLSPVQLLPWQMLIATILLYLLAIHFESDATIHWSPRLIGLLSYIGILATALGYWMIIELSRKLPSVTTSLCMLGVPIFGLFCSHFMLGEVIELNMIIAMILIVIGLVFVIKSK